MFIKYSNSQVFPVLTLRCKGVNPFLIVHLSKHLRESSIHDFAF